MTDLCDMPLSLLGENVRWFWGFLRPKIFQGECVITIERPETSATGPRWKFYKDVSPGVHTFWNPSKALWEDDVIMPQNYGGKNCSNARGKPFENSSLTPQTTFLRFWKQNCSQIEDFSACWSQVTDLCDMPPKPCGGKCQIILTVSETQNLPKWVCDYNSETRNINHGVKVKVL